METSTREGYRAKVEVQLDQWSTRLEALQASAERAGADVKKELLAELAELKTLEIAGREHLATLEAAAASTWDEVKADLTDKWNRVSGAVDAIWARVQTNTPNLERASVSKITAITNGPLLVEGHIPFFDQNGRAYAPKNAAKFALCRCGGSSNKPFCDGAHAKNGFQGPPQSEPGEGGARN